VLTIEHDLLDTMTDAIKRSSFLQFPLFIFAASEQGT
jgi:hypothetical protein